MSRLVYEVCDRCGAQHLRESSTFRVQEVKWFIATTDRMHSTTESKIDLCTPCRQGLYELIKGFIGKGTP